MSSIRLILMAAPMFAPKATVPRPGLADKDRPSRAPTPGRDAGRRASPTGSLRTLPTAPHLVSVSRHRLPLLDLPKVGGVG